MELLLAQESHHRINNGSVRVNSNPLVVKLVLQIDFSLLGCSRCKTLIELDIITSASVMNFYEELSGQR